MIDRDNKVLLIYAATILEEPAIDKFNESWKWCETYGSWKWFNITKPIAKYRWWDDMKLRLIELVIGLNNCDCGDRNKICGIYSGSIPESNKVLMGFDMWIWCAAKLKTPSAASNCGCGYDDEREICILE